jgi:hypothetical protein
MGCTALALFFLLMLLPGHNLHGNPLSVLTLLFGLFVPPILFLIGLIKALISKDESRRIGLMLNLLGICFFCILILR